jgi:23S rRNA (cytidine1920-2'-O)/16S rRNA (cytidine1409-2'-O)-methyltransferase
VKRRARERADVLLAARGLAASRAQAQALILAGRVHSGARRVEKAGELLAAAAPLVVREAQRFVSRGGDKLARALLAFAPYGLDPAGKVCVDVGASTGGFSDCLLQHGAARVHAVDVGHGQLHPRLRADPRVVVRERTHAVRLDRAAFGEPVELVAVDVSFIGIGKIIGAIASWLDPGGALVALVKPQFEAGRREASRGRGVIRDPAVRAQAIARAVAEIAAAGFTVVAEVDCALRGPRGNLERFVLARRI